MGETIKANRLEKKKNQNSYIFRKKISRSSEIYEA